MDRHFAELEAPDRLKITLCRPALDQLGAKLRADLSTLNALLAGAFAELQRRAAGTGVALAPVAIP